MPWNGPISCIYRLKWIPDKSSMSKKQTEEKKSLLHPGWVSKPEIPEQRKSESSLKQQKAGAHVGRPEACYQALRELARANRKKREETRKPMNAA